MELSGTNDLGGCLLIGVVGAMDLEDSGLLIGNVGTNALGDGRLTKIGRTINLGIIRTIYYGECL